MALRWDDIDWELSAIRIVRSAFQVSRDEQQVRMLNNTAQLSILIPEPLILILKAWQYEQGGNDTDYICADAQRRWLHIDSPAKWFAKFIARHHLPSLNLHGLRHTAAVILLETGIPVNAVAAHLGHAQSSTTLNLSPGQV